ncbi:MAG: outer membrane receptor protein, partial [Muribaculaceae bacterium]|nr:outer membrane receptor protein [Muribaculaceae bacterium]
IDASDGELHPFTAESAADPLLGALIKTYNENQFLPVKIAPAIYLNFKASKSIGKWLRISLFVNRIVDYLPDYQINGLTIRRKADAYFGMELNFTI